MSEAAQHLLDVLESLDASSQFCTSGSLAPVLPGLEVQGVGDIGLPIRPAEARQLIQQASQAPYGRGEETIVDTDIRRVWQIEPAQFSLGNPAWETFITGIVDSVKEAFGIDQRVTCDLYKLLIYEKGSFFAPHRDSEKQDGMFATLVVCLPSKYKGGTLVVSHDGKSEAIEFGGKDGEYNIQYAAFYTDCQHEIQPVTSGYRVCLVYNLAVAPRQRQPLAPQHRQQVEHAVAALEELFADAALDKIAIPLEHEYTEAGLSRDLLKGADRSCVEVLARAAEQLDYQLHLALMTFYQTGEVEPDSWDYGGYGRWHDYDDDSAMMGEVFEESRTLDYWVDAEGHEKPFGKMQLDPDEMLVDIDFDDVSGQQEVHEATGNEGVTMERWYRQAMVVLWPQDRYFYILANEGQNAAVPALAELIGRQKNPSTSEACRTFAEAIISRWKPSAAHSTYYGSREGSKSSDMLQCLNRIADPILANRFIQEVLSKDYDGTEGQALSQLCNRLGWAPFSAALADFVAAQVPGGSAANLSATVSIFEDLCCRRGKMSAERKSACQTLAAALEPTLKQWDSGQEKVPWQRRSQSREGVLEALFRALCAIGEIEMLQRVLAHAMADPEHYDLHQVVIPAVQKIHQSKGHQSVGEAGYRQLLQHCLDHLEDLTKTPVQIPSHWTQDIKLSCNCADCKELQQFLLDSQEQVHRFRVRKDRRQHLHQQIDRHGCDMTHVTDRRGSPQTLVCTKNRASYERQQKQFEKDTQLLAELRVLAEA